MERQDKSTKGDNGMSSWIEPRLDWSAENCSFDIADFNRIKNNLIYLCEEAGKIWGEFDIEDMGEDISSYEEKWEVASFNAIESNLDIINQKMLNRDYGFKKTFYENGVFITYDECLRIESATLNMYQIILGWYEGITRLSFVLGTPKGLKS